MAADDSVTPPLPPGFQMDEAPPLPPGFELDEAEGPSFGQQAKRAAGLSARQVGPRAAAAGLGAVMGAPLAGVGAIPGALAGLTAFELVNLLDKVAGTNFLEKALTAAGLPTAETDTEKLVEGTTEAMS